MSSIKYFLFLFLFLSSFIAFSQNVDRQEREDAFLYSSSSIHIGPYSEITGDFIFSSGSVTISKEAIVRADLTAMASLKMQQRSHLLGDVYLGEGSFLELSAQVEGLLLENQDLVDDFVFPDFEVFPEGESHYVEDRLVLDEGSYQKIIIASQATLVLRGGDYHFYKLVLEPGARLQLESAARVFSEIPFTFEEQSRVNVDLLNEQEHQLEIYVRSKGMASMGSESHLRATVYLPQSQFYIDHRARLAGSFFAESILIQNDVFIEEDFICEVAPEICDDGIDQDCDGLDLPCDEDLQDLDGDGLSPGEGDCNDQNDRIFQGAREFCDDLDNDCDGEVDEDPFGNARGWFRDNDGDGYGSLIGFVMSCARPEGYVGQFGDCDDGDPDLYPSALEICDGVDNNCSGEVDEAEECQGFNFIPPDPSEVAPQVNPTVETSLYDSASFIFNSNNPIQRNVNADVIKYEEISIIRGKVIDRNGQALSSVKVTVHGRPEYGFTATREDGWFDIAVNGGKKITIQFEKEGYLTSHRKIETRYQSYSFSKNVVLIPYDHEVSHINLQSEEAIQVARGTPSEDEDGFRQSTLFFKAGTRANMILADNSSQEINQLSVRSTEYTIGENGPMAMPAELPATSGYTYAVELSVDEAISARAKKIEFSQPVIHYVENFLSFPNGGIVPLGYYDREIAAWVPANNGKIIQVISIEDGVAQVDISGNGHADVEEDLLAFGLSLEERIKLGEIYQVGQSLWRVEIDHFTPWDCNWPYGPPRDIEDFPSPHTHNQYLDDCLTSMKRGSIIECEKQVLGEEIPILGSDFSLFYQSDRLRKGSTKKIQINLTDDDISEFLENIYLRIIHNGELFEVIFPADENLVYNFHPVDQRNSYGQTPIGSQAINIQVGYEYQAVYYEPAEFEQSFSSLGNTQQIVADRSRQKIIIWSEPSIQFLENVSSIDDWFFSEKHSLSTLSKNLYFGSGESFPVESIGYKINHIAGTDREIPADSDDNFFETRGDGYDASQVYFNDVSDIEIDSEGRVYLVDHERIRMIGKDNVVTTLYEAERPTFVPNEYFRLALDENDDLYFLDILYKCIKKINPDGSVNVYRGPCDQDIYDREEPESAIFKDPTDITIDRRQNIYIVDRDEENYPVIKKVSPNRLITLFINDRFINNFFEENNCRQPFDDFFQNTTTINNLTFDEENNLYFSIYHLNFEPESSPCNQILRINSDGTLDSVLGAGDYPITNFLHADDVSVDTSLIKSIKVKGGNIYFSHFMRGQGGFVIKINENRYLDFLVGGGSENNFSEGMLGKSLDLSDALSGGMPIAIDAESNVLFETSIVRFRYHKIYKAKKSFETKSIDENSILIPSTDANLIYEFNNNGKHIKTLSFLTGEALYDFQYNQEGYLTSVIDGDGQRTTLVRDDSNLISEIISPFGHRTFLSHDENSFLNSVSYSSGESYQMEYDERGFLTIFTNPRGASSHFTYNQSNRLINDEGPLGDSKSLLRNEIDQNSYEITLTTKIDDEINRNTRFFIEKNNSRSIRKVTTDANNLSIETLFNRGSSIKEISSDGSIVEIEYASDPLFGMTSPLIRSEKIKPSEFSPLEYSYSESKFIEVDEETNQLLSQNILENTNGNIYRRHFSFENRLQTETSQLGRSFSYQIDGQGRVTQENFPALYSTYYEYGHLGLLTEFGYLDNEGEQLRRYVLEYNPQGLVSSVVDPLGRETSYVYDAIGRVTEEVLPGNIVNQYAYDANGNLRSVTPSGKPSHHFSYNLLDLEIEYNPPIIEGIDRVSSQYDYNLNREITSVRRADDGFLNYEYDQGGRLSRVEFPRGEIIYSYDQNTGSLINIQNLDESLIYNYDGFLTTQETWFGSVNASIQKSYNNDFLIVERRINNENPIVYRYDDDLFPVQIGDVHLNYHPENGLLEHISIENINKSYEYNSFGEVNRSYISINNSPFLEMIYQYDDLGRIIEKREVLHQEENVLQTNTVYHYDISNRLERVERNGEFYSSYEYGPNGNRTSYQNSDSIIRGVYDDQDRLISYGENLYTYNAHGDLETKITGEDIISYDYDVFGNLRRVTLSNDSEVEYIIDGRNRRVGKVLNGQFIHGFIYKDQLSPIAQLNSEGDIISQFIYGSNVFSPDYMIKEDERYRIIKDERGSVRFVINMSNSQIVQEIDYDEYGKILRDTNPGFQPFAYIGGLYDQDTKLLRLGVRDYDPEIGRWTSKDSILTNSGTHNFYEYSYNDPISFLDINGRYAQLAIPLIIYGPRIVRGIRALYNSYNALKTVSSAYQTKKVDLELEERAQEEKKSRSIYNCPPNMPNKKSDKQDRMGGNGRENINSKSMFSEVNKQRALQEKRPLGRKEFHDRVISKNKGAPSSELIQEGIEL